MGFPTKSNSVSPIPVLASRNLINQVRGGAVANSSGSGIPKHVTNVRASIAPGSKGTSTAVRVLFNRDPADTSFTKANVFVKGYQGNAAPVQIASGTESPITCVLNSTGENLSISVQSSGNAGDAPFESCPTTGATLPKSAGGGYSTSTTTYVTESASSIQPGTPIAPIARMLYGQSASQDAWGETWFCRIPGGVVNQFPAKWNVVFNVAAFEGGGGTTAIFTNCQILTTAPNSRVVTSRTPVKFGGSSSPTFSTLGEQVSDAIALQIEPNTDYWFIFLQAFVGGNDYSLVCFDGAGSGATGFVEGGSFTGDQTAATTLPSSTGTRNGLIPVQRWISA